MKKILYYVLITAVAGTVFLAAGCELFNKPDPVTITERITLFTEALNLEDRTNLYTHFHEDTQNRQQIASSTVVESGPMAYANRSDTSPFVITITDQTSPDADGKVTVTATFVNANLTAADPGSITFVMKEIEATVWYILSFTLWIDVNDDDVVDADEEYVIRRLY